MRLASVVMVTYPGTQVLDVVGPLEVFAMANDTDHQPRYRLITASPDDGEVATSGPTRLVADTRVGDVRGPVDTLIVAGGNGVTQAIRDERLLADIRRLSRSARRVASVCTGSFLLAEAGVLDGRRATTHWSACDELASRYPTVTVERDPIFTRDGNVYTSAGVTAGIDLALALVEEDVGREVALSIARRLVLFLRRPGNQSQFSSPLLAQVAERDVLREVQRQIADEPGADHSVAALAERAGMSPRHFARSFGEEVGTTPARFVESVRLEAARRLLEETTRSVDDVARTCGFGTAETMRRAFLRSLHVAPAEYRRRFQTASAAS